ncbi:hypothetical protein [Pseudanabaena sp. PCC 6802]|uniref:hypothetical protein n=1 Tax=Pseudanabaena sp. PCC 6802 TaxID=118173 RepID=UPI0012E9DB2B|nr:hypothetical protein [Pseudanabaena sp. PCC 6802]
MSNLDKTASAACLACATAAGGVVTGTVAVGTGTGITVGTSSTVLAIAVGPGSSAVGSVAFAAGMGSNAAGSVLGIALTAVSPAALPFLGVGAVLVGIGYAWQLAKPKNR